MTTDITVTMTRDEVQYLLNSMDTHLKTHGLSVATAGVVILAKLQAAANGQAAEEAASSEEDQQHESTE